MRANGTEVALTCQQEDHQPGSSHPYVGSRFALGGLEHPIEPFQKAISLTSFYPSYNATEVSPNHLGDGLHGVDLQAHDIGAPLKQHSTNDVGLLSLQNLARLFPVLPRPHRPQARDWADQGVQFLSSTRIERRRCAKQLPAHALERRVGTLLNSARPAHTLRGLRNDVALMEGDLGVRQVAGRPADKSRRHVDDARLDLFGIATEGPEFSRQLTDSVEISTLSDEDHGARLDIGGQHQVVVAAGTRALVDRQAAPPPCGRKSRFLLAADGQVNSRFKTLQTKQSVTITLLSDTAVKQAAQLYGIKIFSDILMR